MMAILPPTQNKTHNPALTVILAGKVKKKSTLSHVQKGEVSYREIGLTTVAVTQDLLLEMPLVLKKKELIHL